MKFFTADLHFHHTRIVDLSHRPFADLDEMHHALITNWNNTVKHDDDIVYILGDFTIESGGKVVGEYARQLRGRKRLIEGNHDACWMGKSTGIKDRARYCYDDYFELIAPWAREKLGGIKVVMSHFPFDGDHTDDVRHAEFRLKAGSFPLLHGHTHSTEKVTYCQGVKQVHVGVDAHNYHPISEDEVVRLLMV